MRAAQSGLTFYDLQLRVGEASGFVEYRQDEDDNRAIPPTDPNRIDRVKRAINDAAREFYRAVDETTRTTHRWTWLKQTISIALSADGTGPDNIDGDSRRYRLPDSVTTKCNRADWTTPDYPGRMIQIVHDGMTRRHWAMYPDATGAPLYLSVVATPEAKKVGQRTPYEMIIAPAPSDSRTFTVVAEMDVRTDPLTQDGDYGPWSPEDDLTVVAWAVALLKMGDQSWERYEAKRVESLRASIAADKDRKPALLASRSSGVVPSADNRVEYQGVRIL